MLSNDLFRNDAQLAYPVAWGMAFYLSEKMPSKFQQFLRNDGNRANYSAYSKRQRGSDFAKVFGTDIAGLEAQMERFYTNLKIPPKK